MARLSYGLLLCLAAFAETNPLYLSMWVGDTVYFLSDRNGAVSLYAYDTRSRQVRQVLENRGLDLKSASAGPGGMSDARYPVFDREGKYLYFTASTGSGPSMEPDLHSAVRPVTRSVYLAVLDKSLPSPLAPESDEEKGGEKKAEPEARKDGTEKLKAPERPVVKIDFDNIGQRVLALPLPPRRYTGLQAGKAGVLLAIEAPQPAPGPGPGPGLNVHRFDLKTRKSDVAAGGVRNFEISANGEKMLYQRGEQWIIAALKPMTSGPGAPAPPAAPPEGQTGALKTESIEVRADPRAEWRQMYREAWRVERDFLYDPGYHGLDLAAAEKKYEPFLENIASRRDLNYLFSEMLGELTLGHLFAGGDAMPWYFRRAGVGKLIGKRTWGGLVGRAAAPPLMDGGVVSAPSSAVWNPNGTYDIENTGVPPDIEVELDPAEVLQGHDPQLEKAVEVVMAELEKNPAPRPRRPPYPNYHR